MDFKDLLAYNVWLDFSFECEYISKETHQNLTEKTIEIGKLINYMIINPDKFGSGTDI